MLEPMEKVETVLSVSTTQSSLCLVVMPVRVAIRKIRKSIRDGSTFKKKKKRYHRVVSWANNSASFDFLSISDSFDT